MKKKLLSLVLAAAMLTGCGAAKQDNANDNKVTVFSYGGGGTYENGMIYNTSTEAPMFYLDYETMEKVPLCAMPNCTHMTSSCLAKLMGVNPVFYGDYIYYFVTKHDFEEVPEGHQFVMRSRLFKAKLDTSEVEEVVEFTDCIPDEWNSSFVLIGSKLWFIGNDMNPKFTQEDNPYNYLPSSDTPGAHFMCSIDLDTGEYVNHGQVCEDYRESDWWDQCNFANLKGIYNGKLQISVEYSLSDGRDRGDDFWSVDPDDRTVHANYEYDIETGECTKTDRHFPISVSEDTYVGVDFNAGQSHDDIYIEHGGEEHIIKDTDRNAYVRDDKVFLFNGTWIDLNDWSEHELPEEIKDFIYCGKYGDSYIFMNSRSKAFKYTEDELFALG